MGYRVSTVGHIDVRPALNDEEFEYLTAFAESRRWRRPEGAWWVPSTPFGMDEVHDGLPGYDQVPDDQPGVWCPWVPSCEGRCLLVREEGTDGKNYGLARWLAYLADTFLVSGARAQEVPGFEGFTFDHVVSGTAAAHRSDSGELWLVRAEGAVVTEQVLRQGDPLDLAG